MHIEVLSAFIFAAVGLTLAPGPDILYVVSLSIASGWKKGVITALGLISGLVFHTLAVAFGVGFLLERFPILFIFLKIVGALYLTFLAFQSWCQKEQLSKSNKDVNPFLKQYTTGLVMNLTNPKVSLFFLGFFPAFQFHDYWPISYQFLFLGLLFILQAFIIFFVVAYFSASLGRSIVFENKRFKWNKIQAILLLSIAILLLLS